MFRLPQALLDVSEIRDYFISEGLDHFKHKDDVILDLYFNTEEGDGDWIEGEGLLDNMLMLRDELMQGDYRVLYLAWLKAAEKTMNNGTIRDALDDPFDEKNDKESDKKTLEPAVPAGLRDLSSAQRHFIEFIGLNKGLIKVAAEISLPINKNNPQMESGLSHLSQDEKDDFLKRLCRNEPALSALLNKRLQELLGASEKTETHQKKVARRSFYELYEKHKKQ